MCDQHSFDPLNTDLQPVKKQLGPRNFLTKTSLGLGSLALGSLLGGAKLFGNGNAATAAASEAAQK